MNILLCDRCYMDLEKNTTFKLRLLAKKSGRIFIADETIGESIELCPLCYAEFDIFLKGQKTMEALKNPKYEGVKK